MPVPTCHQPNAACTLAPKHVLLYHAFSAIRSIVGGTPPNDAILHRLGLQTPVLAHLPLLLNPGGGKLSKRHSHGSVAALVAAEYEPQALVNFVALMGCSFSSDTLPLPDLAAEFDLSRIQV